MDSVYYSILDQIEDGELEVESHPHPITAKKKYKQIEEQQEEEDEGEEIDEEDEQEEEEEEQIYGELEVEVDIAGDIDNDGIIEEEEEEEVGDNIGEESGDEEVVLVEDNKKEKGKQREKEKINYEDDNEHLSASNINQRYLDTSNNNKGNESLSRDNRATFKPIKMYDNNEKTIAEDQQDQNEDLVDNQNNKKESTAIATEREV